MAEIKMCCTECAETLWSNHSKKINICPDCGSPDTDLMSDLDERLENEITKHQAPT